jgi:hypothetical protein
MVKRRYNGNKIRRVRTRNTRMIRKRNSYRKVSRVKRPKTERSKRKTKGRRKMKGGATSAMGGNPAAETGPVAMQTEEGADDQPVFNAPPHPVDPPRDDGAHTSLDEWQEGLIAGGSAAAARSSGAQKKKHFTDDKSGRPVRKFIINGHGVEVLTDPLDLKNYDDISIIFDVRSGGTCYAREGEIQKIITGEFKGGDIIEGGSGTSFREMLFSNLMEGFGEEIDFPSGIMEVYPEETFHPLNADLILPFNQIDADIPAQTWMSVVQGISAYPLTACINFINVLIQAENIGEGIIAELYILTCRPLISRSQVLDV